MPAADGVPVHRGREHHRRGGDHVRRGRSCRPRPRSPPARRWPGRSAAPAALAEHGWPAPAVAGPHGGADPGDATRPSRRPSRRCISPRARNLATVPSGCTPTALIPRPGHDGDPPAVRRAGVQHREGVVADDDPLRPGRGPTIACWASQLGLGQVEVGDVERADRDRRGRRRGRPAARARATSSREPVDHRLRRRRRASGSRDRARGPAPGRCCPRAPRRSCCCRRPGPSTRSATGCSGEGRAGSAALAASRSSSRSTARSHCRTSGWATSARRATSRSPVRAASTASVS